MNTASEIVKNATRNPNLSGADELRLLVRNMDATREDALDRFTAEQLIQIFRMQLASGWDFYPDEWTEQQIQEALAGKPPMWDENEEPIYETAKTDAETLRRAQSDRAAGAL